jgi:hypothetical protein
MLPFFTSERIFQTHGRYGSLFVFINLDFISGHRVSNFRKCR